MNFMWASPRFVWAGWINATTTTTTTIDDDDVLCCFTFFHRFCVRLLNQHWLIAFHVSAAKLFVCVVQAIHNDKTVAISWVCWFFFAILVLVICICINDSHLYACRIQKCAYRSKIPNGWHTDIWCARINVLSAIINIWWLTWWMDSNKNKNKNNNNDEKSTKSHRCNNIYVYLFNATKNSDKKSAWRRADNSKTLITTIINDHIVQYPHYAADQPLSITWNKRRKRPLDVWWAYVCCVVLCYHT